MNILFRPISWLLSMYWLNNQPSYMYFSWTRHKSLKNTFGQLTSDMTLIVMTIEKVYTTLLKWYIVFIAARPKCASKSATQQLKVQGTSTSTVGAKWQHRGRENSWSNSGAAAAAGPPQLFKAQWKIHQRINGAVIASFLSRGHVCSYKKTVSLLLYHNEKQRLINYDNLCWCHCFKGTHIYSPCVGN